MIFSILIAADPNCEKLDTLAMAPKRVLIIDDESDVREVVRGCLEDIAGWEVTAAASGQEGLSKIAAEPPDAILLDLMMPGMDGLTFLKVLRNQPVGVTIPVVLLTAKFNLSQATQDSELDVRGIIPKPFDPFLLVDQFANFLGWQMEV